jgi:hypothetical protein
MIRFAGAKYGTISPASAVHSPTASTPLPYCSQSLVRSMANARRGGWGVSWSPVMTKISISPLRRTRSSTVEPKRISRQRGRSGLPTTIFETLRVRA